MPPARLSVHDIRNSDLVSRLLAATPPYLYSAPVGPPNFFFSDMLRSLVQSKHAEQASRTANAANAAMSSHLHQSTTGITAGHPLQPGSAPVAGRRPRKRTWTQARTSPMIGVHHPSGGLFDLGPKVLNTNNNNNNLVMPPHEKPLELTNKCGSPPLKYDLSEKMMRSALHGAKSPSSADVKPASHGFGDLTVNNNNNNESANTSVETPHALTSASSSSSADLVLPPPPPMWYPPLYPPYGIDPLHFFIDLRVSGHIYDRKKENTSPNAGAAAPPDPQSMSSLMPPGDAAGDASHAATKPRFGSAFSVPQSRRDKSPSARALNLTASPDNSSKQHLMAAAPPSSLYTTTHHTTYDHTLMDAALKNAAAAAKNNTTNYVLQNLPRIYTDLTSGGGDERNSTNSDDTTESKSEGDGGGDVGGVGGGGVDDDDDSGDVVIVDGKNQGHY